MVAELEAKSGTIRRGQAHFAEAPAWASVGAEWRQLNGGFNDLGYSIEWHDFSPKRDFDWSRSFHPGSLEICLNIAGRGEVQAGRKSLELADSTVGFYAQNRSRLTASRRGGERHQFVTIELSRPFLQRHIMRGERGMDPRVEKVFAKSARDAAAVSEPVRLTSEQQQLVMSFRRPPVYAAAQRLWYQAKALEVAAAVLFQPLPGEELFCERYKRVSQERVEKVVAILKENLAEPLPLEELGRRVGCSQFHLSRLFTQEMGKSISAHLRDLRMERASELLRAGKMNVTEAAMEVGYSSLSHFTVAFRDAFGCCPGLYPLKPVQRINS